MAKQFYDAQEAQDKLGISEEELKRLVRDGQLREFRDGSNVRYKIEEVDGLASNLGTLSGSLSGTSGELVLEPADETSMGLTGSDMLTLDEAERSDADGTVVDDQKEDTVITSVGISVFDDEEVTEADPGAKTVMADRDRTSASSMALDTAGGTGSGSGLLDLSRESDDTSLGAELLDEIYTEDQEAGISEMGDATRAGLEAMDASEQREPEALFEKPEPEKLQTIAAPSAVSTGLAGPVDWGLSAALVGAAVPMAIAGIAISANAQGVLPSVIQSIYQKLLVFGGGFVGVVLVAFVIGFFMGKRVR